VEAGINDAIILATEPPPPLARMLPTWLVGNHLRALSALAAFVVYRRVRWRFLQEPATPRGAASLPPARTRRNCSDASAALGISFEGHAQIEGRNCLVAGDGKQNSFVETWVPTPAGMAAPPLHDGSVDLVRRRQ
jgi:hypothetical protein